MKINENEYAVLNSIMTRNSQATIRQICERVLARSEAEVRATVGVMLDKKLLLVPDQDKNPIRYGITIAGFTAWNTFDGVEK